MLSSSVQFVAVRFGSFESLDFDCEKVFQKFLRGDPLGKKEGNTTSPVVNQAGSVFKNTVGSRNICRAFGVRGWNETLGRL